MGKVEGEGDFGEFWVIEAKALNVHFDFFLKVKELKNRDKGREEERK